MSVFESEAGRNDRGSGRFIVIAILLLAVLGAGILWYQQQTLSSEGDEAASTSETSTERAPEPAADASTDAPAPARETRDVPSTGTLSIRANEPGAIVYIDGERVGEAPFERADYPIGRYDIRITKEGFADYVDSLRLRPGRTAELNATLELAPPSLRITSDVPGATVFLDRDYAGTTPLDVPDLSPGEHQLTVSAEGFDMHVETVELTTGRKDIQVNFQTKAQDLHETIAVVHKHRFGSCEGTLVADATGLRYETADDDAFQTTHANLERFEVDYIEKNLNVKIAGGRNYNFTEQSGNADALFVFHKNVQAFRDGS